MKKTITLPENFVFKNENIKTIIGVLVRISNLWRKEVYIDFSRIKQVRKSDLMILMAQLEQLFFKKKQIKFKKNIPDIVNQLLKENIYHYQEDILSDTKSREINPDIVENTVKDLNNLGISRNSEYGYAFYERIKALITEIMGNAVEHGIKNIKNRKINYWLTSEIDKTNEQMTVTFVDMGKGIAYSHKKSKLSLKYRITGLFSDKKIVTDSLYGKLASSTREPFRGKGLPEIRRIVENETVSEFVLITNRILIQYTNNKFISTRIPNFKGTYYCWSINKNNFEKWKTLL